MKKFFFAFAVLALACACTDKIDEDKFDEDNLVRVCLTATSDASVSPNTRASLGSGGLVLWEEDDKIAILSKSGYYPLALTSGAGKPTGTFEGLASQTDDCIAVFPYMESSYNSYDGYDATVACGDYMYQLAVKNNFEPYTCLMAGKIDDKGNVAFKNLVSFVKLTTTFDCHEISIIGNDGEVLSGTGIGFSFDETGTPTDIKACYETSDIVTLSGLEGEKITAGTYYIGVLPQTLDHGFTLIFTEYDSNNEPSYRSKRTAKSVTLKRSGILNLGTINYSDAATYVPGAEFDGAGTSSDPYRISSKQMILKLAELINDNATYSSYADKYYLQTVDIDCGGETLCIGSGSHPFKGTYVGGGHTIGNFVAGCVDGRCGLFGTLHNAVVRQLTSAPKSFAVAWPENKYAYCGGLAAVVTADDGKHVTLQDCHLKSPEGTLSIPMPDDYYLDFGGMIGKCSCDLVMDGCYNETNLKTYVQGKYDNSNYNLVSVGGLVGRVDSQDEHYIKINCCRNLGNIEANHVSGVTAGGIIGEMVEGKTGDDEMCLYLTNAVNRGNVTAISEKWNSANAGGLVGNHDADGWSGADPYICNCLNAGDVLATGRDGCAGGLMGKCYDSDTKVYCCANIGNVSGIYPGMSVLDQADLEDYRKLGALCGSDGGYYYYCRWSNNSDMPIVFNGTGNVKNSIYVNAVTAAMMMNEMRPELVNAGTPTGAEYEFWVINDNGLDLKF